MIDNNIIKQGIVKTINPQNMTCTVYFEEQEYMSSELKIANKGTRFKTRDMPNIGDLALCALIAPSLTDGFVLAFYYNDIDLPPNGDENIHSTTYPDGSVVSYDSKSQVLNIDCKGTTIIKANTINLSGNVIINGKPWLEHQHTAGEYKDGDSKPVTGKSGDGMVL